MKYIKMPFEFLNAIIHFFIALKNYARYGEFTDER